MFIMVSNWQQTNVKDPVEKRMAHTYKEAAMSITITTLTDVLGFYIGLMSDFLSVQYFCLYTSTAIIFCYIYNITFFGAFLALNGRRERSNRHWLTCMKIPSENPKECSNGYSMCCVGGNYDKATGTEKEQPINHFFKKYYGPFLTKPWTKVIVIFIYAGYLAASIYGCFQIQQGIDLRDLAADDSYVIPYYDNDRQYFSSYGPNVMVIVSEKFPYWDKNKRSELLSCMEDFKKLQFITDDLYTSWLDYYEGYARSTHLNIDDEIVFSANLFLFLNLYPDFKQDVNFTSNAIHASRFFIQTVNIVNASMEIEMVNSLKETAESCSVVPLIVYHPAFIYYDQYAVIVSGTLQNIGVTTAVMLIIALLLIPNPLCSLWVTFSIVSVIVGVTGFMALWDVNLDSISMIILVVCIGFSVDFSAHISYAFVSNKKPTANEKAVEALFHLGYPILQGALSTILGVIVLSASKNYIFRTFFKIMFLVIFFGLFHGITFIPVFLTFFDFCSSNAGNVSPQEKRTLENQAMTNCQPKNIQEKAIDHDKQIYDNHTFLPDNQQLFPTQPCPSVWTLTVNTHHTQSGQMCMASTVPMFRVDSQTYEVQMYTASNDAVTVNCNQNLGSGEHHCVIGNNQPPVLQECNAPVINCSDSADPVP